MALRILRQLVAVLAIVPFAVGCGARAVSGTAIGPTNGLESKTSAQVVQASVDALRAAGSVHISGTVIDDSAQPGRVDVRIQATSFTGTITVSGANIAVTVIGDSMYFRTDAAGWNALGQPDAAPYLADKWVQTPADMTGPTERFTIDLLANEIRQQQLGPGVARTTLNGAPIVVVTYLNGDQLYVANTGTPHVLRFNSAITGDLAFSEHGTDFHIMAPPAAISVSTDS